VDFSATELLLFAASLQLACFAIAWGIAYASLQADRTLAQGFLHFNGLLSLALSLIALRAHFDSGAFITTVPNYLILGCILALALGLLRFWNLDPDWRTLSLPLALSFLGVTWFGFVQPNDSARVFSLIFGFIVVIAIAMWRSYFATRREFGSLAADGLCLAVGLAVVLVVWRGYIAGFTEQPVNLNNEGTGSELGLYALLAAVNGPNLLYAYFVAMRLLRRANEAARTDGLTGLKNHRAFMDEADTLWHARTKQRIPGAAIAIDLDHFKRINDEFGHAVGDEVLRSFSTILRTTCEAEHLVGRTGGEEFIVIVEALPKPAVQALAERIMRRISRARILAEDGREIKVTVSVGIAFDSPTDVRPNDLLLRADSALYTAKERGRNRIVFA
jgi:diguanylate cyclase (GGDEF)-like protein